MSLHTGAATWTQPAPPTLTRAAETRAKRWARIIAGLQSEADEAWAEAKQASEGCHEVAPSHLRAASRALVAADCCERLAELKRSRAAAYLRWVDQVLAWSRWHLERHAEELAKRRRIGTIRSGQ